MVGVSEVLIEVRYETSRKIHDVVLLCDDFAQRVENLGKSDESLRSNIEKSGGVQSVRKVLWC